MGNDLACKLTTPELRRRRETVIADLRSRITNKEETADGCIYVFPATADTIRHVTSFIETERQCCEFFSFRLSVPSGSPEMHLEISGPQGAKEFLKEELGL